MAERGLDLLLESALLTEIPDRLSCPWQLRTISSAAGSPRQAAIQESNASKYSASDLREWLLYRAW
jgi:hypothetical protein